MTDLDKTAVWAHNHIISKTKNKEIKTMPTATVPVLSFNQLIELSKERLERIEEIKNEIASDLDTLSQTPPAPSESDQDNPTV
jgi:hypothetical protein